MGTDKTDRRPQAGSEGPLLTARDLHKTYRMGGEDVRVLRGATLTAARGEWVAVLGASGSGKSTLLHLLGGLDRPDQGLVTFASNDIFARGGSHLDRYRSTQVGFVFQFYHLLPELSALENVLIASMINRSIWSWPGSRAKLRQRATELLDRLGLSHRLAHKPAKLSGGERQRVAIARALINDPPILLADEPTGNLDADTGDELMQVFRQFHGAGQTIIMVTHDNRVAQEAQRRLKLESGRLQESG